jgi:hypothetical protein
MPGSSKYSSHLSAEAVAFLFSLPRRKQRKVLDIADRLAAYPLKGGDYRSKDAVGHMIESVLMDEFLFAYWVDHSAREVRITEILRV